MASPPESSNLLPVLYTEPEPPGPTPLPGWITQILGQRVILLGVVLAIAQTIWKGTAIQASFLDQEDLRYIGQGYAQGFGLSHLLTVDNGHVFPGVFAISAALAHIAPYNWTWMAAILYVLQAAAALAVLRMLVVLFGPRPAILVPYVLYLLTPLNAQALGWWAAGVELLPFQIAAPLAIAAHVQYLRTGQRTKLVQATAWIVIGLLFYLKTAAVPVLLFALTGSYFVHEERWQLGFITALRKWWRAWLTYAGVLAIYGVNYVLAPHTTTTAIQEPRQAEPVVEAGWALITKTLVPGALGGPWRWVGQGPDQPVSPPVALLWISWIAAVLIIGLSFWYRRRAIFAWMTLLLWVVLIDLIPTALGRQSMIGMLGTETRYVTDTTVIVALVGALAFIPLIGEENAMRRTLPQRQMLVSVVSAAMALVLAGAATSVGAYNKSNHQLATFSRFYVTNVELSLKSLPTGSVVLDQQFPDWLMWRLFVYRSLDSYVMAPYLAAAGDHNVTFTRTPQGTIDNLYGLDNSGYLRPVAVSGVTFSGPKGLYCMKAGQPLVERLAGKSFTWTWVLYIPTMTNAPGTAQVSFGGHTYTLNAKSGIHSNYISTPVTTGDSITIVPSRPLCVWPITIGQLHTDLSKPIVPGT